MLTVTLDRTGALRVAHEEVTSRREWRRVNRLCDTKLRARPGQLIDEEHRKGGLMNGRKLKVRRAEVRSQAHGRDTWPRHGVVVSVRAATYVTPVQRLRVNLFGRELECPTQQSPIRTIKLRFVYKTWQQDYSKSDKRSNPRQLSLDSTFRESLPPIESLFCHLELCPLELPRSNIH